MSTRLLEFSDRSYDYQINEFVPKSSLMKPRGVVRLWHTARRTATEKNDMTMRQIGDDIT
jgi:hypothetical protein